ncbi:MULTISPECIES: tyrosine-protein phosphatase [unclassified Vagococcus]|uniref:tyrosine-protein phosphatase n=1 Tax=unclassified Vagococcus TaxID=2648499 RepID=UPI001F505EC9|nr:MULTISPECIES: CpsB/CapC family capsule biosynthesis tyrosine phosphatase [unclassified Vagococcus]MCI0130534.1 tyrosine protein phosphatase [Vagococcus sp. CY53-2]UNM89964.1 tyrosine protein phosphatase [Vagococcus sp. CY52-2]
MVVDLHCHILPGIDDGAQSMEDSLFMARAAVSEGISHILCTPHYNNGHYLNKKADIIEQVAACQKILDEQGIPLTLFEGQEVRISPDLSRRIVKDDILFADLNDQYLLIEFPFSTVPDYSESVLSDLCQQGYRPIIVHPERNNIFLEQPKRLQPFIDMGCLSQVTNGSYIGQFGKKIQRVTKQMIKQNYAHMLSSDAHNVSTRGFYTKAAYDLLEKEFGKEKRNAFVQITKDIVNGEQVEVAPIVSAKKHWGFS